MRRAFAALLCALSARAFDAEPTHAAMTESAVLASSLDGVLKRWGFVHGVFAPLTHSFEDLDRVEAARLRERLQSLDPGAGYAPSLHGPDPMMRAVGWLVAGSVLEDVPATRARHHFLDPETGRGLDDARAGTSFLMSLLGAVDVGGSFAGLFTGSNFDITGEPADVWADASYQAFLQMLRLSATAQTPIARQRYLARALLSLGSVLHVLQDMASPSRVRNDFRAAHLSSLARLGETWVDRGAQFERFVAQAYGSTAPVPGTPGPTRARLRDFFHAKDRLGLADFTARHFFSPGTLPEPVALYASSNAAERLSRINQELSRAEPGVTSMKNGYVRGVVPHLLRYRKDKSGKFRFDLDQACYADYARALVPEAVRSSRDLIGFALRGQLEISPDGGAWGVVNRGIALGAGKLEVLGEDAAGRRWVVSESTIERSPPGATLKTLELPADARAAVAVFSGVDEGGQGEPLVIVEVIRL